MTKLSCSGGPLRRSRKICEIYVKLKTSFAAGEATFSQIFALFAPFRNPKLKNDIMTNLSDEERKAQMADMKSFDEQMPCVGIFWYDPEEHNFFGVHKKELTPKMVEDAAEKGKSIIVYPETNEEPLNQEYLGRIVWNTDKFIVLVGKWAEPIQEELTELLEKEFSLPYFEYVYDEHWDLGHGWSGDMP